MSKMTIPGGTVHSMPVDWRKAIIATPAARKVWDEITPLARNEWICWVTAGKKSETRDIRIKKGLSKLKGGMHRPCCWIGCVHRTDKKVSKSVQWVLDKQAKSKRR